MPRVLLVHGTADSTCPVSSSQSFAASLRAAGVLQVEEVYVPNATHTDLIIEQPARGSDPLLTSVVRFVRSCVATEGMEEEEEEGEGEDYPVEVPGAMVPLVLVKAARWVCPF
jgi:fermentation-respiration switch protein FrsA (DUF1100 family)